MIKISVLEIKVVKNDRRCHEKKGGCEILTILKFLMGVSIEDFCNSLQLQFSIY